MLPRIRIRPCLLLCIAVVCLCAGAPVWALARLVVLPFANPAHGGDGAPVGETLARMFAQRLAATGRCTIVEREALGDLKTELNRINDPDFDPSTVPAKGGLLGADLIVKGAVLDFGHDTRETALGGLHQQLAGMSFKKTRAFVRLSVQLLDLKTGKVLYAAEKQGRNARSGAILAGGDLAAALGAAIKVGDGSFSQTMIGQATLAALDPLVKEIAPLLQREARVLAVNGDMVVLDTGSAGGIKVGQRGRLSTVREIKNQQGRVVWNSRRDNGAVEVVEVQRDGSLARLSGQKDVAEGDLVDFGAP